ncbi:MAG: hypothetical protein LBK66_04545 [Spirochaetaceae bacterium]|jgi:hypothetical protein|nr:hypothetical protein [Spirochaetaceae bacterium]
MYAIKAEFDGTKITPKDPVPVNEPYEAVVTFTSPKTQSRPKENIFDFAGIFDCEDVAIIEEIIRERREPSTRPDFAVS